MKWMVDLYDRALIWSQHKHAAYYLAVVSFVEASVFPIPPYFMLAPMALSKPQQAFKYAGVATLASVSGGLLGYILGYLLFKPLILPLIEYFGHLATYDYVLQIFRQHGFVALLILGMSPIPFKFIAIGAGFLALPVHIFIAVSLLSRGMKFFAVSLVIRLWGNRMQQYFRTILERFGLLTLGVFGAALIIYLR